ncbi:MAG: MurNAc alpha-1-phosphate uridylyltransferase [Arenicella sp.]|jgi:MurNAc alpha-1-phosphate uridylyltransferase
MDYKASDTTVVLLAAGQGKRMLRLTQNTPKPLLKIGEHALIEHHLIRLREAGFRNIVINLDYLGHQIRQKLGNGERYDVVINYSDESDTGALETAGGLEHALPLIRSDPFLVVNSDLWTDYPFNNILKPLTGLARLVVVKNPAHNKLGDFSLSKIDSLLQRNESDANSHTFSGIALYHKAMFTNLASGCQALAPIFFELAQSGRLEGEVYSGQWTDVGTPERLQEINDSYSN